MATTITGSPYISILDSKIIADACAGNFIIDVTPSTFTAGGAVYVKGASVKITNPVGVVIRNYITSGYDIVPPMTGSVSIPIPLVATNYLYGDYTVTVKLTDADGTEYFITKQVSLCPADSKNKTKKQGCLSATISGSCKEGKVIILLDEVPTYKGIVSSSQVNAIKVDYPTASGLVALTTTMASFSVILFEGVYKVTGTVCATYYYGDNVFFKVQYKVDCEKKVICKIDKACIQDKIDELNARYNSDCTDDEKAETASIILQTLFLLEAADNAAEIGNDPSDYIAELEALLGCSCSCNCNEGTPYIDNTPATDYSFAGCGFTNTVVGLTRTITLNNYRYELINAAGSPLVIGAPVVDASGCIVTQTINFDSTNFCTIVGNTFTATAGQKNTIDNTLYGFLISGTGGCQKIFAPTGFAVSGTTRKSAFGKMEWYNTLALATAAAGAGETVLIYQTTAEPLIGKNQVHFFGIGTPSVNYLDINLTDSSMVFISNIKVLGTQTSSIRNISNVSFTNVDIEGSTTIQESAKAKGANFIGGTGSVAIVGTSFVSNIYSEKRVIVNSGGELNNFEINYIGNDLTFPYALQLDNTDLTRPQKVSNGKIKTLHGSGLYSFNAFNTETFIENITSTSTNGNGVYVQAGEQGAGIIHKTIVKNVTGVALNNGIGFIANQANPALGVTANNMTFLVENCTGISKTGVGISGINANLKKCLGYSDVGIGILIAGSDVSGKQQYIIDCIGESKTTYGLSCGRDIFITGGTYISRGTTANANPIKLIMANTINQTNGWVAGVTTIAVNTTAFAIVGDAASPFAVTARISGCQFLNENLLTGVPGIDPLITLRAVSIDAAGNTK